MKPTKKEIKANPNNYACTPFSLWLLHNLDGYWRYECPNSCCSSVDGELEKVKNIILN